MTMPVGKYITKKQLRELGGDVKRLWKSLLALLIIVRRLEEKAPVEVPPRVKARPAPEVMAPLRILVIDNDPTSLSGITLALSVAGFETVTASDCPQGLIKLDETSPNLVLLADALPDSGETCSQIRRLTNTPVIMMGTDPGDEAWDRAVSIGADAYLRKSIGKVELAARVKAILRRYQRS